MKYGIEAQAGTPAYLQLYRQIREDIVQGVYPHGGRLPSKRTLAAETGVSTVTAEHAYALLCDEGYAESRERSGYFVCFRAGDGFAAAAPPGPARPPAGCLRLREALRQYLARSRGIVADETQIVVGAGSEYLYGLIVELLGRDRVYAIESPSYKMIKQVYRASDVRYERLPLGADGIDSAALRACNADVLHISPYRSFPSGVTASASKRHEYLRWAAAGGRFLVEDDFESEFSVSSKPEETLFSVTADDNTIYMNTFSKTVSPSLRVGYMVLPKRLTADFDRKLGFYSCTVPTFMQHVLAALLENGDFERHINRVRRQKRKALAESE